MAILRRNAETVEVVGLDEAYVDLTGLFSPKATMRRIASEIREETGLDLLDRHLREPHAGQDHQRAGQARRPRRALAGGGAGALRRRVARPGPGDRAEDGRPPRADGHPHAGRARRPRRGRARAGLRAADRRLAAPPRPGSKTRRRSCVEHETKSQSTEITFDVDVADREAQDASIVSLAEELCRRLRSRDLRGRTIGIKVRLDDWTNVTRSRTRRAADRRPGAGRPRSRSTCCAPTRRPGRCACSASGSRSSARASPPARATRRGRRCELSLPG